MEHSSEKRVVGRSLRGVKEIVQCGDEVFSPFRSFLFQQEFESTADPWDKSHMLRMAKQKNIEAT